MVSSSEKNAIKELKEYLIDNYNLTDLRIFGSKVKEIDTSDSDIDIMVMLDNYDPSTEAKIDSKVFEINLKYDCLISVILYSQEEIEKGPMSESPLYKKIMKEGLPI
ncbi:MAG: hypothetical protein A2Z20_04105 [Bdellovibrionales bacterium RBG_16_40_8]|nr:MAG: hypothetical protein A2Z20_04105 [Bdellovibrionales bacterium RBG_16_40_8]